MFDSAPQTPVQYHFQQSQQHQPQRSTYNNLGQARQLIGRNVKINRGGPDSLEGRLLAVNGEVLALDSMGTIIYVNGRHVKSITEGTSKGASEGKGSGGKSGHGRGRSGLSPTFITASAFNGVLKRLRQQFVQINRGGPEKLEGFLADTNDDFILLIVGREFVRVPIFHIKTVNRSGRSGGNKKNNDQSGGNRSSGGNRNRSSEGNRNRTSGANRNRSRNRSSSGNRSRNRNRNRRS